MLKDITFTIARETPSKKNCNKFNTRTGAVYKTKTFDKWYKRAKVDITCQAVFDGIKGALTILHCESIDCTFYHKGRQRHDSDNQLTTILDLLVDCKVLQDDNYKVIDCVSVRGKESDEEKCVIEIRGALIGERK